MGAKNPGNAGNDNDSTLRQRQGKQLGKSGQETVQKRQLGLLINGTACTSPNSLLFFLWCNSAVRCTLTPDRACCTSLGCVARLPSGAGSASRRLSRGVRKGATQAPLELLSFQSCRVNPPSLCAQIDMLQYTTESRITSGQRACARARLVTLSIAVA